ncbi:MULTISPECIES: cytochrome C oxidase subunit IV family protein [Flavobacterium]|uniref:Cytochrome C oxidase subunit IV n=2 Tax=Flavobacterium TaxID=237 RepID=A0AA94F0K7_9FLAO|nr:MULTISPECIES: cytochrome C oxidase subunit IV family protein [Flavobacterium]OXA83026.1 cytochrome C oxidase subunit IV [Flavobacterium columnare NBRC 100251 = ATCC 23463]AMA50191.1 cytochrome C oxidase subunit IV [Flavobacterium covae]AND64289.1 cytochrome C oxidase subunit IV [Flavobacterium covae]MCH4829405.1 cytochrome C oxidase subunit IV family protein [Flavobacterium columnare]MCH4834182.1 cytochrome C oxidase subunit IV family protein [Flavobacterium columnare]
MGHAHESNAGKIWKVFGILSVITIIEVVLGIYKPHSLYFTNVLGTNLLNWIFIILTVAKAYGIMWSFMHLEGEVSSLRWSIVAPLVFLIIYLVFILLVEADYVFGVFKNSTIKWNF